MDLAKTLIRSVARTFYDLQHVLVVDALMVHSAYARLARYHERNMTNLAPVSRSMICTI